MIRWDIVQRTPEWHEIRKTHIGGSEVGSLYGPPIAAGWQPSRFSLWQHKAGRAPAPKVDDSPGTRIWMGVHMEPTIIKMAGELYGWKIRSPGPMAFDDEVEGMSASLDAVIVEPGPEELALGYTGPGLLEAKYAQWLVHKKEWLNDEPPTYIILQTQQGLACTGFSWGVVVVLTGEMGLIRYRYRRRESTIATLRRDITEFWRSIRDDEPPLPDGHDSSSEALRVMFPERLKMPMLDRSMDNELDSIALGFKIAQDNLKESRKVYAAQRNLILWKLRERSSSGELLAFQSAETSNTWISAVPNKNGAVTVRVSEKPAPDAPAFY